jgi:GGDEF domain-containing protein
MTLQDKGPSNQSDQVNAPQRTDLSNGLGEPLSEEMLLKSQTFRAASNFTPEERWHLKVANTVEQFTSKPLLERKCAVIRADVPDGLLCFMDKDNVGVFADVGLDKLADYLFEQEGRVFKEAFGPKDKFVRYAGDEFIYITNNSKSGERKIAVALHLLEEARSREQIFDAAPRFNFFGADSLNDLQLRLDKAENLARVSKTMSAIMGLFRQDVGIKASSAALGDWLFERISPELKSAWLSSLSINRSVGSFAEVTRQFDYHEARVAHALQAFVAREMISSLTKTNSVDGLVQDKRITEVAKLSFDKVKLFGVSYSKVKLSADYTPLDIKRAIVKAEKDIHANKIAKTTDIDSIKEVDPHNKLREIDERDLKSTNAQVERYYEIRKKLLEDLLDADQRLDLLKEAFDIAYGDPASPDCLRLGRVHGLKTGILMDIPEANHCSAIRFSIPGFGTFNKYMRMDLADDLFSEMMTAFESQIKELVPQTGQPLIKFREGGGKGVILIKDDKKPNTLICGVIANVMQDILKTKLDSFMEMPLYEKRAFKEVMGLINHGKSDGYSPVYEVKVEAEEALAYCNIKFGDFYLSIWDKTR